MTSNWRIGLVTAAAATLALSSTVAYGQVRCGAGRTASDACVETDLLTVARQTAVIFSQPKISHTAFPVLPSADRAYRYPNQLIPDQSRITPVGTVPPVSSSP
jgi:hypothetical protein